jgi:uncharacterized membrane protein (UPF0127 family)
MFRSTVSRIVFITFAAFFIALSLQSPLRADGQPMILPTNPVPLVIHTARGPQSFSIEIAQTDEQEEAGLMYRKTMDSRHGMLFVLEAAGIAAFWMENTPMPLDLIFIGEKGKIRAIRHGVPYSKDIISPKVPVRFVLELKAGTAAKYGIAVGDRVSHPAIAKIAHAG